MSLKRAAQMNFYEIYTRKKIERHMSVGEKRKKEKGREKALIDSERSNREH